MPVMHRYLPTNILQSKIFKNYIFLSIYQVVNFLVPIVIFPFIIKKIGIENFGKVAFSYAFVNYFSVLTDYGFNLSATKNISTNRQDLQKVNEIYTSVLLSKLLFFIAALLIFLGLLSIPVFRDELWLNLFSFTVVLGQVLMPVWLFQGMEDMKYLAIFNTVAKVFYAVLIVILVRHRQDYILVNLLQGIGGIIAALGCHALLYRKFNIRLLKINASSIKYEIKDGFMLFLSSLAVNIYVNSNVFILGMLSSAAAVGYYSVAEKVYFAIKQFNNVFSQVIFPKVCVLAQQSLQSLNKFLRSVFIPFISLLFLVCLVGFIFAGFIASYFLKQPNAYVAVLIRVFCFVPIIVAFDIPAFQSLLALNQKQKYGSILIAGCIINIILNFFLARSLSSLGTALSVLITELFITVGLTINFKRVAPNFKTKL